MLKARDKSGPHRSRHLNSEQGEQRNQVSFERVSRKVVLSEGRQQIPIDALRRIGQVSQLDQVPYVDVADPIVRVLKLVVHYQHQSLIGCARYVDRSSPNMRHRAMLIHNT